MGQNWIPFLPFLKNTPPIGYSKMICMKIRIQGNSIRFRLTKSNVAELCKQGCYEESTYFDKAIFAYGIHMEEHIEEISAEFKASTIILKVPKKMVADWDTNDKVGFQNSLSLKNGDTLELLLEKDFTCLENRAEDESDNYPNPKRVK